MKRFAIVLLCLLLAGCGKTEPVPTEPPETLPFPTESITVTGQPTEEPTQLPTEPPAPEPTEEPEDGDLVRVRDFIPDIREELAYAGGRISRSGKSMNFTTRTFATVR